MSSENSHSFDLARTRAICRDLFKPNPAIYWLDLVVTATVTYTFAGLFLLSPLFSIQSFVYMLIAGFGLHRQGNFIHEIAHLNSKRALRSFRIAWNIIVGIPTMMPSFFFEKHMDHHKSGHFGTRSDCEYVALGKKPTRAIGYFLGQVFLQPIFTIFRFVIVTPVSFMHPKLRAWTLRNYSTFAFVLPCPRQIPQNAPLKFWAFMDIACSVRAIAIFAFVLMGINPWTRVVQIYMLALVPLTLHYTRSLTAHAYLGDGKKKSFSGQLKDSIDITGVPIFTELLYPIGLRYHALHHLFPSLPYHNMTTAHRRLMAELPADSPYRDLVYPSFLSVIRQLVNNSRNSSRPLEIVEAEVPRQSNAA